MLLQVQNLDPPTLIFLVVLCISVISFFLKSAYNHIVLQIDKNSKDITKLNISLVTFIEKKEGSEKLLLEKIGNLEARIMMLVNKSSTKILGSIPTLDDGVPMPQYNEIEISSSADPLETLVFMEQIVDKHSYQIKELADILNKYYIYDTCKNIWDFVRANIRYEDDKGEQLRTPARTYHDGAGDCDCMSIFIASLLLELGIDHVYRIASYSRNDAENYEHVYIVAFDEQGLEICLDTVPQIKGFNQEYPLINYHDHYPDYMKTTVLNGLKDIQAGETQEQFGIRMLNNFIAYLRSELDKVNNPETSEQTLLEYQILNQIEASQNDGGALAKAIRYAIKNSVFSGSYQDLAKALEVSIAEPEKTQALGNPFSFIVSAIGEGISKVAGGIDLIAGGQRKRAAQQNDSNERQAQVGLEIERERLKAETEKTKQAEAQARAIEAKAKSDVQITQNAKNASKVGEETPPKKKWWVEYWWALAIVGVVLVGVISYFAFWKKKPRNMSGIRRRRKAVAQVKGVRKRQRRTPKSKRSVANTPTKRRKKRAVGKAKRSKKK